LLYTEKYSDDPLNSFQLSHTKQTGTSLDLTELSVIKLKLTQEYSGTNKLETFDQMHFAFFAEVRISVHTLTVANSCWKLDSHVSTCKIWGSHGGDYEEWCLLGSYAARLLRTDVSEEPGASFIRVTRIGELGTTQAATSNRTSAAYIGC
jgi:hypothetical protein